MMRRFNLTIALFVILRPRAASAASTAASLAIHPGDEIPDRLMDFTNSRLASPHSTSAPPIDVLSTFDNVRGGNIIRETDEKYDISLSPLAFATIFGFLGGWTHVLCNKQFDVYTAMVSGHIVNMSIYLAEKNWKEAAWRISIVGSYFGGVAAARSVELRCQTEEDYEGGSTRHFKIIAPAVVAIFCIADKLTKAKVALLTFGNGLIYPSVSASLGGTITHLMTGHTTSVARNVGGNTMRNLGVKTSICVIGSVVIGGIFGVTLLGVLGDDFPYFSMLGVLYALALLLL